jgi:endogenous inhibitor of DNA gyrase (YacG/DUF329 family)
MKNRMKTCPVCTRNFHTTHDKKDHVFCSLKCRNNKFKKNNKDRRKNNNRDYNNKKPSFVGSLLSIFSGKK